jgi:transposase
MFGPAGEPLRVFVRPGATDMRKQINGLAVIVEQQLEANPFEDGALYLFCNRERRILKALYWDATGFCLWQKRLEKHRFPWPQTPEKVKQITREQLSMLLSGIDFWQAHSRLSYRQFS